MNAEQRFQQLVQDRMAETDENYSTALKHCCRYYPREYQAYIDEHNAARGRRTMNVTGQPPQLGANVQAALQVPIDAFNQAVEQQMQRTKCSRRDATIHVCRSQPQLYAQMVDCTNLLAGRPTLAV
jgi:hypothetical protein